MYAENFNLLDVITPVKVDILHNLLIESGYDKQMTDYIINGFQNGFELGYRGNTEIRMTSPNLKLRIGDEIDLWNKIKKEVKLSRFAGSYKDPPFIYFYTIPTRIGTKR